jgi:hypothetical protein
MDTNRTTQSEPNILHQLNINEEPSNGWLLYADPAGESEESVTSNQIQVVSTLH